MMSVNGSVDLSQATNKKPIQPSSDNILIANSLAEYTRIIQNLNMMIIVTEPIK